MRPEVPAAVNDRLYAMAIQRFSGLEYYDA